MEKMAYFKEITDGQHLDDVDISVHCDIKIFDWLMCWVKYDNIVDKPSLDSTSVVSILVSASFLKARKIIIDRQSLIIGHLDIRPSDRVYRICLQEYESHSHSNSNF